MTNSTTSHDSAETSGYPLEPVQVSTRSRPAVAFPAKPPKPRSHGCPSNEKEEDAPRTPLPENRTYRRGGYRPRPFSGRTDKTRPAAIAADRPASLVFLARCGPAERKRSQPARGHASTHSRTPSKKKKNSQSTGRLNARRPRRDSAFATKQTISTSNRRSPPSPRSDPSRVPLQ